MKNEWLRWRFEKDLFAKLRGNSSNRETNQAFICNGRVIGGNWQQFQCRLHQPRADADWCKLGNFQQCWNTAVAVAAVCPDRKRFCGPSVRLLCKVLHNNTHETADHITQLIALTWLVSVSQLAVQWLGWSFNQQSVCFWQCFSMVVMGKKLFTYMS